MQRVNSYLLHCTLHCFEGYCSLFCGLGRFSAHFERFGDTGVDVTQK